jgi:hypothetical protein
MSLAKVGDGFWAVGFLGCVGHVGQKCKVVLGAMDNTVQLHELSEGG